MANTTDSLTCTIEYEDRDVIAPVGNRLLDIILDAGIDHRHVCGGNGFCTSCRVEILSGVENLSPVSATERQRLGRDAGRLRLACQTFVCGDISVRPARANSNRFSPDGD